MSREWFLQQQTTMFLVLTTPLPQPSMNGLQVVGL